MDTRDFQAWALAQAAIGAAAECATLELQRIDTTDHAARMHAWTEALLLIDRIRVAD